MIKKTDFGYEINETVTGGYLQRSTYASYEITSKWDKNLNFITLTVDNESWEYLLNNKDEFHHNRAIRAKSRHLRELKAYLGLEKPVEKEIIKRRIIWSSRYYGLDNGNTLKISEFEETDKMFSGKYKKNCMNYIDSTPEKEELVKEYMKKLNEFEEYKKDVFQKIFNK